MDTMIAPPAAGIEAMQAEVARLCTLAPVIPVIVVEDLSQAVPMAQALVAGGLPVLEVTLRSAVALDAIALMAKVPGAVVGAGTVVRPDQIAAVRAAGARFMVSPGAYPELVTAALDSGIPFLPGAATPSEMMALLSRGIRHQKLFPATVVGGLDMLKALASPLSAIRFCPTGGVTAETAPTFLSLPNVLCVGGSWVTPKPAIQAGDWATVERLAREAAALRKSSVQGS
ncbi:bifunctional 4-hydroxy-2-oxoglutarate aldolase/2-dehydro-3-deoxy-phosphogluconate aldolase [Aerophototrophica crusticola]